MSVAGAWPGSGGRITLPSPRGRRQKEGAPLATDAPLVHPEKARPGQVVVAALHGPVWVWVICMTISMSPPVGTLPFVVIVTSVFFAAIVPVIAMSTVWPFCVQVPATSILPFATSFFDQVHWPPPLASSAATSSLSTCSDRKSTRLNSSH